MTDTIIKHFFIFLSCIHMYHQLLNHQDRSKLQRFAVFPLSALSAVCTYFLKLHCPGLSTIIPILILWIILGIISSHPQLAFVTTMLSFGVSYCAFTLASVISLILFMPLYQHFHFFSYYIVMPFAGILTYLTVVMLFRIKRFRKGMPFLYSTAFLNRGTIICLLLLGILTYLQAPVTHALWLKALTPIVFIAAALLLIRWWQSQLTKSYLARLQKLELESLRNELQEKNKHLQELQYENDRMSRLIHKDNKLIPAMENAVYEYLTSQARTEEASPSANEDAAFPKENSDSNKEHTVSSREDALSRGNALLGELHHLSENRREILSTFSTVHSRSFATGIPALDALLSYMDKQAKLRQTDLIVHIQPDSFTAVPNQISSEDLVHLLADLMENAMIATSDCTHRILQLQIYTYARSLIIELSDTGIPFEITSLMSFGLKQLTTHADTGGSGIGLMDIWELKNKYAASLHITEYKESAPFCKKIAFLLDNRNQYLIYSWRYKELLELQKRTDMHILPNVAMKQET